MSKLNRSAVSRRNAVVVLATVCVALPASSASAGATLVVHVHPNPSTDANVHVGFRATPLPEGGYYYGVLVLRPYKRYTAKSPPPCATSSDMQRTDYGYPKSDGSVSLTLTRTPSRAAHWCRGGTYSGAIYAVPHAPPCEAGYPCRAEPYERSPCFEIEPGRRACGVVVRPPEYRYPGELPRPLAAGTKIVARFTVVFR